MALIQCKECKASISSSAKSCPSCGAPVKARTSIASLFFVLLIGYFLVTSQSGTGPSTTSSTPSAPAAPPSREEIIQRQFSAWDGSHRNLERLIKAAMNDPDSYEHDETRYIDNGDTLTVLTSYRGKNAFGGVVRASVTAVVDLEGNVIEIVQN